MSIKTTKQFLAGSIEGKSKHRSSTSFDQELNPPGVSKQPGLKQLAQCHHQLGNAEVLAALTSTESIFHDLLCQQMSLNTAGVASPYINSGNQAMLAVMEHSELQIPDAIQSRIEVSTDSNELVDAA